MKINKDGVTILIIAVILIVVILAVMYFRTGNIEKANLDRFTKEMTEMQVEVNEFYNRYTAGEENLLEQGKDLDKQADKVFTNEASGIINKNGYRYYDRETIKKLGIDDIEGEFFVNVEKRSVVSYYGLEYDGKIYYTLDKLPSELYNPVDIGKPSFETLVEQTEEGDWKITITNVEYNGYINNWQVKYKKEGNGYWSNSQESTFIVQEEGIYKIFLQNGDITSDIKTISIGIPLATVTAQITSTNYNDSDRQIKEKIIQTSNGVELDYSRCKWVYNTQKDQIGTDETRYTGGNFKSQEEEIILQPNEPGEHYLHILTVDVNGDKMETIIRPIVIRINSVYDEGFAASGLNVSLKTNKEDIITLSNGKTMATTGNDGNAYLLFNKINDIDEYFVLVMNGIENQENNKNNQIEIDLANNVIKIENKDSFSGNIDNYGVININTTIKENINQG